MYRLPKKEINEIAQGIVQNQIFCSDAVPENMLMSIFMPLVFMSKEDVSKDEMDNLGQIIGDMKDTFNMSVNGYPIFHACRFINKQDWKIIVTKVRSLEKAMKKVLRESTKEKAEDYSI